MQKIADCRRRIVEVWNNLPEEMRKTEVQAITFLFQMALYYPSSMSFDGFGFTEALQWLEETIPGMRHP
jgi:hypothetical protein